MGFATQEGAIAHLAEGVRGLADTWQETAGQGAGMWGAEVGFMHEESRKYSYVKVTDRLCETLRGATEMCLCSRSYYKSVKSMETGRVYLRIGWR